MPDIPSPHRRSDAKGHRRFGLILLAAALALGVWGVVGRIHAREALREQTIAESISTVAVVKPKPGSVTEDLTLPGTVEGWANAPIYARTNGYLKRWLVDIGTVVKKDQLMAEIDAPEIDQQLRQAQADLATAEANEQLARSTAGRWQQLLVTGVVSKQQVDEKNGDAAAKKAALESARANLGRLKDLESFKRVLAPFDGTVTQRNTDMGALINAGTGQALFRVADTHRLRVYVQVPQADTSAIAPGLSAEVRFAANPQHPYPARLLSTANAINPDSRSLLAQLEIDNSKGEILAGGYAEVHFKLPADSNALRLPSNTLLFRSEGLQVATVGDDLHVALKSITLGRDFGTEVEVTSGVDANDRVVLNPPDSIIADQLVRLAAEVAAKTTDGK